MITLVIVIGTGRGGEGRVCGLGDYDRVYRRRRSGKAERARALVPCVVRHLVGMEALASGTIIAVGGELHGSTVDEDGSYAAALAIGGGERIAEVIGGNGYGRGVEVEADIRGLMLVLLCIRVVTLEQVGHVEGSLLTEGEGGGEVFAGSD